MSNTGRYYTKINGRTFCIEPIDNSAGKAKKVWGDINPATKKIEGSYGNKTVGAIHEDDSIIKEENGFKNITILPPGVSPEAYIESLGT